MMSSDRVDRCKKEATKEIVEGFFDQLYATPEVKTVLTEHLTTPQVPTYFFITYNITFLIF